MFGGEYKSKPKVSYRGASKKVLLRTYWAVMVFPYVGIEDAVADSDRLTGIFSYIFVVFTTVV